MHVAFMSIGGVLDDLSMVYDIIYGCIETSLLMCDLFDALFTNNRILYLRLRGIALLD
jgi:NADH:ubiquinone oxidoreductase subunit D